MTNKKLDVLIIGAGLTGLCLAKLFNEQGISFKVLEANSRIGGRIFSQGIKQNAPIEMGATWLGSQHTNLLKLLEDLHIEIFPQEFGTKAIFEPISTSPHFLATLPPNNAPSFRIKGGTANIAQVLAKIIGPEHISLHEKAQTIKSMEDGLLVETESTSYQAEKVISTLPPNLLLNSIQFEPSLPSTLTRIASNTHTWMGESIKIALSYSEAFWQNENSSGTIMSNVGPIHEMYEHCNFENSSFALMGFLNGSHYLSTKEERKKVVLGQLRKYYGARIENYVGYHEKVWREEPSTFTPYEEAIAPHQNNGHPIFQDSFLDDRFIIAGSETSPIYPGYMEGAVYSAKLAFAKATAL